MPVSVLDNFTRFSDKLRQHYCLKVGAILSPYNSAEENKEILDRHYSQLFDASLMDHKFVGPIENWEFLPLIYKALANFGKLSADDGQAFLFAEKFPSILLFNKEEYALTWEFLHYLGRRKFFKESNFLLGHLYSLKRSDLLHWAAWLNPGLNEYNKSNLVEFIYTYCETFNFTEGSIDNLGSHLGHLADLIELNSQAKLWIEAPKVGLYRFLQHAQKNEELYHRQFKYGLLVYRHSRNRSYDVFVPNEFASI